MRNIKPIIEKRLPEIIALRRDLHAHPEVGYQEFETAKKILEQLERIAGIDIRKNVAKTGIVATIGNEKSGPCVALRADMDCLAIQEESNLDYASKNSGYMHACGHDGHTACLVGAALVLSDIRNELAGPVKFIFQPAEEGGNGGLKICEEDGLKNPKVDAIFGMHCIPDIRIKLGDIAVCDGPAMAGFANFAITIHGKGGHTSTPHHCIDPIFVGMQIVNAIQSIVPRTADPLDNAVVMVSKFNAGKVINVVPEKAEIGGTIRSLSPDLLEYIIRRIESQTKNAAKAYGASAQVVINRGYPVLINDSKTTTIFNEIARSVVSHDNLKNNFPPNLGGEDFAYYLNETPGTFWFLAMRPADNENYPFIHNPRFDFNDDAIALGIEMHCEIARRFPSLCS